GAKFNRDVLPIVTATDALTAHPVIVVTLDGRPYPANTAITEEKADHVISATATDDGGNIASVGPFHFLLDKTRPVVTIVNAATGLPFCGGLLNAAIRPKVIVADISPTTVTATLDGAPFDLGAPQTQADSTVIYTPAPIAGEGAHTFSVVATDPVNAPTPAECTFTVDTTTPHVTITD